MLKHCIMLVGGVFAVFAQAPTIDIKSAVVDNDGTKISVLFSARVAPSGPHLDITKVHLRGGAVPGIISIARVGIGTVVEVGLDRLLTSGASTQICFPEIAVPVKNSNGSTRNVIVAPTTECVTLETDVDTLWEAQLKKLTDVPKTSSEKNIFASGFVTTASSGSEGGADIALNPDFKVRGVTSFLNIKKTTTGEGDPKHFEGGVRYRGVLPWGRGYVQDLAGADTEMRSKLLADMGKRWFAGALLDISAKLEGEPSSFDITNFVGNMALDFRSRVKNVTKTGHWRGFLVPFAFEGGQNLNAGPSDQTAPAGNGSNKNVDWIARYKAGAGMTLYYDDPKSNLPLQRVELDISGVVRNLFFREAMYNRETRSIDETGKGFRGYGQVDLKLFVGQGPSGRYGVKLTYNRGSLPPVFARVKSFQFGFVFESKDDQQ